jgi:hypothetical protein
MQSALSIKRSLLLPASKDCVWQALTDSDFTRQYMFNCDVITDWQEGSMVLWVGTYAGYQAFQKGLVMKCVPCKELKYSLFDPYYECADELSNYVHISYKLEEQDNRTKLVATIDNFGGNYNRYSQVQHSWDEEVLPALENLFK